jgi:hypothetical protein
VVITFNSSVIEMLYSICNHLFPNLLSTVPRIYIGGLRECSTNSHLEIKIMIHNIVCKETDIAHRDPPVPPNDMNHTDQDLQMARD